MPVLRDIGWLVTPRTGRAQGDVDVVPHAALAWHAGRITWVGAASDLPRDVDDTAVYSAGGALVVPGLVDAHTHLAFAGSRADEFARRARGESYLDIARSGGGILRTVRETRQATDDELAALCAARLSSMARLGVTTIEAKTGYGLDLGQELRLLRLYRHLARTTPVRIVPTLLAAHVVPPEYGSRRDEYMALVCDEIVPAAAAEGLARFCDVFVEDGAFTAGEAGRIARAAHRYALGIKLHVNQLHDGGGAALAADLHAVSADHLEHTSAAGMAALARAGVVAVSLPFASLHLGQPAMPARRMLETGVAVGVATDFNPGSAPSFHLPYAMGLACAFQRMTPSEVLDGATRMAARAIGLEDEIGTLEVGKAADLTVLAVSSVDDWLTTWPANACVATFVGGHPVE